MLPWFLIVFTRMWGFYLEGVWLWRISGGYSQEMMGLILPGKKLWRTIFSSNTL